jgi:hypothetical protein
MRRDRGERVIGIGFGWAALVSRVPDSEGKISSLPITNEQLNAIIQKLERDFGPAVKRGVKEEQDAALASAAMLYTWKPATPSRVAIGTDCPGLN